MKFLIVASMLVCACMAQGPQQKRGPAPQQNNYQDYQDQPQQAPQQQQQQQYQELRPRSQHESTTFIPIIKFDKEQGEDGSYKTSYETGNNIFSQEEGFLKSLGPDPDSPNEQLNAQVQQGSYSYTAPDGQLITVHYTADEKGFHPTGDHLPTPPPVSPEVQKGLDLIYAGIRAQQEQDEREARDPKLRQQSEQQQEYQNNNYRQ